MTPVCAGCWRPEPLTPHESGLSLCCQCSKQLDRIGRDPHAGRLVAAWTTGTAAREAYEARAKEATG